MAYDCFYTSPVGVVNMKTDKSYDWLLGMSRVEKRGIDYWKNYIPSSVISINTRVITIII